MAFKSNVDSVWRYGDLHDRVLKVWLKQVNHGTDNAAYINGV
jgi:hypothetical protein